MNQLVIERTAPRAAPAVRPVRRPTPTPAAAAPHEVRSVVGVAAGVIAILVLAVWSFSQGWGRDPIVGPGELAVDGGIVRVEGAVSAARPMGAMPGMGTDKDPVADGDRRISVDVTLLAGASQLRYAGEAFVLEIDGKPATHLTHRDVLPGKELPPGTSLSGSLLFDIPAEATVGMLSYDGGPATEVVMPAEAESVTAGDAAGDTAGSPTGAEHADAGHGSGG